MHGMNYVISKRYKGLVVQVSAPLQVNQIHLSSLTSDKTVEGYK